MNSLTAAREGVTFFSAASVSFCAARDSSSSARLAMTSDTLSACGNVRPSYPSGTERAAARTSCTTPMSPVAPSAAASPSVYSAKASRRGEPSGASCASW
jgi:hypothetical protein